jgi:hypothetical protein
MIPWRVAHVNVFVTFQSKLNAMWPTNECVIATLIIGNYFFIHECMSIPRILVTTVIAASDTDQKPLSILHKTHKIVAHGIWFSGHLRFGL